MSVIRKLKTASLFPVNRILHRFSIRTRRYFYRHKIGSAQEFLFTDPWQNVLSYHGWIENNADASKVTMDAAAKLIECSEGTILNQSFLLATTSEELVTLLTSRSPLWQENYSYLHFLLPLVWSHEERLEEAALVILSHQLDLWWQMPFKVQFWSTYAVSQRIIAWSEILHHRPQLPVMLKNRIVQSLYQDARYVYHFLEWDVQGNHLVRNIKALLIAGLALEQCKDSATWLRNARSIALHIISDQILPDGVHMERTPMYHAWVLQDILEMSALLKSCSLPESGPLMAQARRMLNVLSEIRHASGQLPCFGDTSLQQIPDLGTLYAYATLVSEEAFCLPSFASLTKSTVFPDAGWLVLRNLPNQASLIMDFGDFGPRALPAHGHCDLASIEVHVKNKPIIVDSGVSEYQDSKERQYFRGTGAHNTLWVPGEEQADIWGSFRVGAYPRQVEVQAGQDIFRMRYQNHNGHYTHLRQLRTVADHFWLISDYVCYHREGTYGYSLLHLHPDCVVTPFEGYFLLSGGLIVIALGGSADHIVSGNWQGNLNLYSASLNGLQPGHMLAIDCPQQQAYGWALIPCSQSMPQIQWQSTTNLILIFENGHIYSLVIEPHGINLFYNGTQQ